MDIFVTLTYRNPPDEIEQAMPQLISWASYALSRLKPWNVIFFPEYGKTTGQLHWHGKITYEEYDEQRVYQWLGKWRKNNGFYKIHVCRNNPDTWKATQEQYISKSYRQNQTMVDNEFITKFMKKEKAKQKKIDKTSKFMQLFI